MGAERKLLAEKKIFVQKFDLGVSHIDNKGGYLILIYCQWQVPLCDGLTLLLSGCHTGISEIFIPVLPFGS